MNIRKMWEEELKRKAKILEQEPIRIGKIAQFINENFPENIKVMNVSNPVQLNWLKDNQYALVLFDLNKPHKPLPVIVEFDENNNVKQIKAFHKKDSEELKNLMKH